MQKEEEEQTSTGGVGVEQLFDNGIWKPSSGFWPTRLREPWGMGPAPPLPVPAPRPPCVLPAAFLLFSRQEHIARISTEYSEGASTGLTRRPSASSGSYVQRDIERVHKTTGENRSLVHSGMTYITSRECVKAQQRGLLPPGLGPAR
ncbi:GL19240 [Drosophila persimilis]|uniref:GL19240 n=1 Tax=Drosophila persimilis TaxID=7234 RepID=B4G859_DROPE|nr:GL19240 [Drosophila persimilis]